VSLEEKVGVVRFDPAATSVAALREAVEDCGFDVLSIDATSSTAAAGADPHASDGSHPNRKSTTTPAAVVPAPGAPSLPLEPSSSSSSSSAGPGRTVTLAIRGMSCQHCADWVRAALARVDGVRSAEVYLARNTAVVSGTFNVAQLVRCISNTGYSARLVPSAAAAAAAASSSTSTASSSTAAGAGAARTTPASSRLRAIELEEEDGGENASLISGIDESAGGGKTTRSSKARSEERTITLRISGMSCASCVAKVEEAALTVPGVAAATVNLLAETATVRLAQGRNKNSNSNSTTVVPPADPEDVAAAVTAYGYQAEVGRCALTPPDP
jgi:Cu+-exporting ATPase